VRLSPSALRAVVAKQLTPGHKLWLSRLRHREHPWQRRMGAPADAPDTRARYDSRHEQIVCVNAVRDALTHSEIAFVELPRLSIFRPILVVHDSDASKVVASLTSFARQSSGRWAVHFRNATGGGMSWRQAMKRPQSVAEARCHRSWRGPDGREMSTSAQTVTVELWEELGAGVVRADGGEYVPGTVRRRQTSRTTLVEYLEPGVWANCIADGSVLRLPAPHIDSLCEPVDLVYTWVDGADPAWRKKMLAAKRALGAGEVEETAIADSRFVSRDELKYSLRSVEYYASWVNHIYIVTDDQIPEWLDLDNPRITVIDHREIFSDSSVLPVFNSHAIESQLHHIPGLRDKYVYLNDDIFFLRPTDPELFFTGAGLAKHFPSVVPLDVGLKSSRDLPVMAASKRGRDYLVERYGRAVTHRFKHAPHSQLRQVLEAMEAEVPEVFKDAASSKFRSPSDYSIPSSLHHFDAAARGLSVESGISYEFVDLASEDLPLRLDRLARREDLDVVCLNETILPSGAEGRVESLVDEFLAKRFPIPSSFEKMWSKRSTERGRGADGVYSHLPASTVGNQRRQKCAE
jgi:hypothetical protein